MGLVSCRTERGMVFQEAAATRTHDSSKNEVDITIGSIRDDDASIGIAQVLRVMLRDTTVPFQTCSFCCDTRQLPILVPHRPVILSRT